MISGRRLVLVLVLIHAQCVELRQLVYFDAVVRFGGFPRASEQLHIAQPAISAQIRQLETELGAPLLLRTSRRVALTQAGEVFLARTRHVLDELDGARGDLAELSAVIRGRVTLGATQVLGSFDLPAALAGFAARHPGVALTLRSGFVTPLLTALAAAEVDLVLGPVHGDLTADYVVQPLSDDRLVLLTPPGHALADQADVAMADLRDEQFVCLPAPSGLRQVLDAVAADVGFEPHVAFETSSPSSVRDLVSAGLGVALLAASAARDPGPPVDVHAVHPVPRHPPFGVFHLRARRLSPAARSLLRHLEHVASATTRTERRSTAEG